MRKSVVNTTGGSERAGLNEVEMDAAFQVPETGDLRLEKAGESTLDYLTHQVARLPVDLRNHCRRIILQYDLGSPDDLYSSLLDLFFVLGNRGHGLRKRMLEGAKARLSKEQYTSLLDCLDDDIYSAKSLPTASASILSQGIVGVRQLVSKTVDSDRAALPIQETGPLAEARACLEYSQIAEAQKILENALQKQPDEMEIHMELLEIYRSTRDKESFLTAFEQIDPARNPVPDAWEKVANFLIDHD